MEGLEEVPQFLPRLEADGVSGRDLHLDARLGIAADAFLPLLDLEDAEAAELDALPARERVPQPLDHRVDRLGRLHARDLRGFRHLVDDVRLDHGPSEGHDDNAWNAIGLITG